MKKRRPGIAKKHVRSVPCVPAQAALLAEPEAVAAPLTIPFLDRWVEGFARWVRSLGARLMHFRRPGK